MTRKMKDSGIEWIGEIPEDWEVIKVKHLFNVSRGRVISKLEIEPDGKYPVYSSQTENNGIFGYLDTYDYSGEALTWTTDGEKAGTVFYRNGKYNCTNICGILQKKEDSIFDIDIKFLYYAIRMVAEENKRPDTNGHKIMSNEMEKLSIPITTYERQKQIGVDLDNLMLKINETNKTIKKQIQTLEDYKKSVITEAVTKGLDKNIEMKDSGIEWIGEIPRHWKIGKTLFYLKMPITDGPHTTPTLYDEGVPFVSAEAVASGKGKIDFNKIRGFVSEEFYLECCKKYIPEIDDVYMIKSGATTGLTAIVDTDTKFTIWSPLAVFRADISKVNPKFLFYVLQSNYYITQVELYWNYGTQQNIGMRTLEKLKICAPSVYEQEKIVKSLDKKTKSIDEAIEGKQKQLEILEEYKKSLIYEYVTGKKEVGEC